MVYWRVLNIDGFIEWRFNWLVAMTIPAIVDSVYTPSPTFTYITRKSSL